MRLNPRVISSAAAIAMTCAVTAAAYFYKKRSAAELNEVMVFCKLQFNAYNSFDKLISHVEAARKTVSICMPGIQNPAIQGRLVKLMKKRNIKVRIIIDQSGYDSTNFLLKELIDTGAEIKCNENPRYQMRHKFCLVDDKILMTGTLNWGNDRASDHWNYVYITSKSQLVDRVKEQFYNMWNEFTADIGQGNIEKLNETGSSDVSNAVAETSKCIQQEPTFRETVTTPEVYIT